MITEKSNTDFEQHRQRLFDFAYRMLGSVADAEDVVQDTFLRWIEADATKIDSPAAYLTTITTRLALDLLRRRKKEREMYVGPWLPEPWTMELNPSTHAELADSLSLVFLKLMEELQPIERAVFLLHDVFQYKHDEIATMLGESTDNCRQLLARAKQRMALNRPRHIVDPNRQKQLLNQFLSVCATGEIEPLKAMLYDDVRSWSDGGGKATAAMVEIVGPDRVAKMMIGLARRFAGTGFKMRPIMVNGSVGMAIVDGARIETMMTADWDENGRALGIYFFRNPEKMRHVRI
jgi:RNA polymerase sigma-70 factor, ECF subfamily